MHSRRNISLFSPIFNRHNKKEILRDRDYQGIDLLQDGQSILRRISVLRKGSKSISNHGFCFSQPVLRQDGCGSGSTRGRDGAQETAPPVHAPFRSARRARASPICQACA